MESLPTYMQWIVSLATILSSIGVIVAFVQLRISGNQFKQQLKLTEDQFKLLNQGFVKMSMTQQFITNVSSETDPSKPIPLDTKTSYLGGKVKITLENVGNLPVQIHFSYFKVLFNDIEFYSTPQVILDKCNDIIHPKTDEDFFVALFPFNEAETPLNLAEIANIGISYSLLIEYYDYNDIEKRIKTIERDAKLEDYTIFSTRINDKL